MRTFKFRGRRLDNGEWTFGLYLSDTSRGKKRHFIVPEKIDSKATRFYVNPDTVTEYTGINAQDGAEIYEGDVIQIEGENETYVVVFYEGAYGLARIEDYICLQRGEHPFLNDYARLRNLGDFENAGLVQVIGDVHTIGTGTIALP